MLVAPQHLAGVIERFLREHAAAQVRVVFTAPGSGTLHYAIALPGSRRVGTATRDADLKRGTRARRSWTI